MVKKISAVLLALVLCFSVVVMPASAAGFASDYDLASGMNTAYKLEWDKTSYNPGDTAYLRVYMRVADGYELSTGNIAIGFNSSVITKADNPVATIKANAVASEAWTAYWKAPASCTVSWLPSSILSKIQKANTAEENALYDQYMKIVIGRDTSTGTGEFATDNTHGVPAAEINALGATPLITFAYKVSKSVAPGTELKAAITSGTLTSAPAQTTYKYMANAGVNNSTGDMTGFDVSAAVATATVGAAGPALAKAKGQIKMTKTGADTVADDFSFRVISKITDADWDKYFSGTLDSDTELGATNAIQKVGFVVAESGNFAMDAAKAAAKKYAESANPDAEDLGVYKAATTNFIQKKDDASDAFFACRIDTSVLTKSDRKYIAFVQYKDGDGNIQYAFYDEAQEILLNSKYDNYKAAWLSQNQG